MPEPSAAPSEPAAAPAAAPAAPVAPPAAAAPPAAPAAAPPAAPAAAVPPATPPAAVAPPAAKVPPVYTAFELPQGVTLDAALEGKLKTVAGELGLKQEDAQRFVSLGAELAQKFSTDQVALVTKARGEWQTAAKADREIGGDRFDANVAMAGNVFRQFGTPELRKVLDDSGLGDHPEMIRWARRVAQAIGEDRFVSGQPPGQEAQGADRNEQIANRLYGPKPNAAA